MTDEAELSRRGFFARLRGPARDATSASIQQAGGECEDDFEGECLPPWEARRRARRAEGSAPRVVRVLAFECIAGTAGLCATCVERCPIPGAIVASGGAPRVDAALCDGCGACEEACPAPRRALQLLPRVDGRGTST